mmetsp:Transcript_12864/g.17867  ORF Transcript_12864/g.17867 Transcript_12864/m.17867 type:complete len:194 (+) Transcript_12864:190-771(+)
MCSLIVLRGVLIALHSCILFMNKLRIFHLLWASRADNGGTEFTFDNGAIGNSTCNRDIDSYFPDLIVSSQNFPDLRCCVGFIPSGFAGWSSIPRASLQEDTENHEHEEGNARQNCTVVRSNSSRIEWKAKRTDTANQPAATGKEMSADVPRYRHQSWSKLSSSATSRMMQRRKALEERTRAYSNPREQYPKNK